MDAARPRGVALMTGGTSHAGGTAYCNDASGGRAPPAGAPLVARCSFAKRLIMVSSSTHCPAPRAGRATPARSPAPIPRRWPVTCAPPRPPDQVGFHTRAARPETARSWARCDGRARADVAPTGTELEPERRRPVAASARPLVSVLAEKCSADGPDGLHGVGEQGLSWRWLWAAWGVWGRPEGRVSTCTPILDTSH